MALAQSHTRNRLLAALSPDDYALIEPMMEHVPLPLHSVLIEAHQSVEHVIFPLSCVVSTVADTEEGRIEIGVIGREGFVGTPIVLGASQTPHTSMVQASGEGMRIDSQDLRAVIAERPSVFKPLGLFTQSMIVQVSQTAYVNATFDIEARLARWILMMQDRVGSPELPLTHEFLSAMLGVRRPGVTVATHVLEGTGAIRNRRGLVQVRDREKLLELAGDSYDDTEREYERLMTEP